MQDRNITRNAANDEVVAALTAAVAAMPAIDGYKLVVRSFRRLDSSSPVWNSTARMEALTRKR